MTEEQKLKLESILLDLAAEIATLGHPSNEDKWFDEIVEAIRDL